MGLGSSCLAGFMACIVASVCCSWGFFFPFYLLPCNLLVLLVLVSIIKVLPFQKKKFYLTFNLKQLNYLTHIKLFTLSTNYKKLVV
jgi:hypothetical protein